jgi:hypothetical protein
VFSERTISLRLPGGMSPKVAWRVTRALLGGKELSLFELPSAWRPFHLSMDAMWPEVSRLNLVDLVPALEMPVFFLLGRKDPWVPAQTSLVYFDALRARYVELEGRDHLPSVGDVEGLVGEIEEFVTGVRSGPEVDRILATVVFTDVVGSTELARRLGDRAWADLLCAAHRAISVDDRRPPRASGGQRG